MLIAASRICFSVGLTGLYGLSEEYDANTIYNEMWLSAGMTLFASLFTFGKYNGSPRFKAYSISLTKLLIELLKLEIKYPEYFN